MDRPYQQHLLGNGCEHLCAPVDPRHLLLSKSTAMDRQKIFEKPLASSRCSVSWGATQKKMAQEKKGGEARREKARGNVRTLFDQAPLSLLFRSLVSSLYAPSNWMPGRGRGAIIIIFLSDEDLTLGSSRPHMTFFQGLYSRIFKDNFALFKDPFLSESYVKIA